MNNQNLNEDIFADDYFKISTCYHQKTSGHLHAHSHPFNEIFYLNSGSCTAFLDHKIYHFCEGDFVIVPAGTLHKTNYDAGKNKRTIISFSKNFSLFRDDKVIKMIEKEFNNPSVISIPSKRRHYINELLLRMSDESKNSDELSDEFLNTLLKELLLFLIRYKNHNDDHLDVIEASKDDMQDVANYIYENYTKNITLEILSNKFGIPTSSLSRSFKKSTGFGIKEYLTSIRIQNACKLLLSSNRSITDIAYSCGFNDSNYFGDAFKKVKGTSPSKYRKAKEFI